MTYSELVIEYPKISRLFMEQVLFFDNLRIDSKLESFLFEHGYSLGAIYNVDSQKDRPYIVYNENYTNLSNEDIFNEFEHIEQGSTYLHIVLPVALKHLEKHLD